MDLPQIVVSEDEARAKLAEYTAPGRARYHLDDVLARAYRAVTGGARMVRLSAAIRAGGTDDKYGLPKIAIAGAEWERVWCRRESGDLVFADGPNGDNRGAAVGRHTLRVGGQEVISYRAGQSIVPLVPPRCRPRRGGLARRHILFEAEWGPAVPVDPWLLQHVLGDLWIVLDGWELTELEAAVLA